MIQRIQSIYLLLAAIVVMITYYVPIAIFVENNTTYNLYACHILHPETKQAVLSVVPMAVLPLLSLFFSVFAIFKFKNRSFQIKLGKLNMLILITLMAVQVIYFIRLSKILSQAEASPFISAAAPLLALILVLLANRAIKKDDNLVKSADRIR